MSETSYNNQLQIMKIDAAHKFLEALNCKEISKICLNFNTYDANAPKGAKITGKIGIFIDYGKFLVLSHKVLDGSLFSDIEKGNAFRLLSGTPASSLAERNAARPDGMSESRQFVIQKSTNPSYVYLSAERGPGEIGETGLIIPRYGPNQAVKKPDLMIGVPIEKDRLMELALLAQIHIESAIIEKVR